VNPTWQITGLLIGSGQTGVPVPSDKQCLISNFMIGEGDSDFGWSSTAYLAKAD
jgi:hypothetical protein